MAIRSERETRACVCRDPWLPFLPFSTASRTVSLSGGARLARVTVAVRTDDSVSSREDSVGRRGCADGRECLCGIRDGCGQRVWRRVVGLAREEDWGMGKNEEGLAGFGFVSRKP